MSDPEHLKSLLKQAELYRTQGLLTESRKKYMEALLFLKARRFKNQEQIEETVKSKIRLVDKEKEEFDLAPETPQLSKEVQELIKKSFAFSRTKEAAAMEGAVALAKFGQYEGALAAFEGVLKEGTLAVPAAKNIIRCHVSLSGADAAIAQYREWVSREAFLTREELKYIREFLADILKTNGIEAELPELDGAAAEEVEPEGPEEDTLDISAVSFEIQKGPLEGKGLEFNVAFQLGNVVSIIVSAKQKDVLESLRTGTQLPEMQCFSPITLFRGSGRVSGRSKIQEGPRQGDYMVDITIEEV
jgi:tetratricopeptide (TPR) repeat protein